MVVIEANHQSAEKKGPDLRSAAFLLAARRYGSLDRFDDAEKQSFATK